MIWGYPDFRKLPFLFVGIKKKLTQPHWARPFRMGIWIKIIKPLGKWDSHPSSWLGLDILRPKTRFRDHVLHFVLQLWGLLGPNLIVIQNPTIHRVYIYICMQSLDTIIFGTYQPFLLIPCGCRYPLIVDFVHRESMDVPHLS